MSLSGQIDQQMPLSTEPLPRARHLSPLHPYQLEVELRSGQNVFLDLEMLIRQRDAHWRLKQFRHFSMVGVDPLGGICWPEGEDLAPDGLDRYMVSKR